VGVVAGRLADSGDQAALDCQGSDRYSLRQTVKAPESRSCFVLVSVGLSRQVLASENRDLR
jgi:hypothetical protein